MDIPKITFKNSGEKIRNDIVYDQLFETFGPAYTFTVFPKSKYWRFGMRFSQTEEISFDFNNDDRHQNNKYKDLHLSVGNPLTQRNWEHSNRLELTQYHFDIDVSNRCDTYQELSTVQFGISFDNKTSTLSVSCISVACEIFKKELRLHDYPYFKIFAWADGIDFELDCVIEHKMNYTGKMTHSGNYTYSGLEDVVQKNTLTDVQNKLSCINVSNDQFYDSKDLLGFEKDIRSFASIMSLKTVKPPLAIALFGSWGTGKSFFMNNLQKDITHLSANQTFPGMKLKESKDKIFCEGILQIQFNAWSYLDANLWAGLVANIFEKIDEYVSEQTKGETQKQKVRDILNEKLEIIVNNRNEILETKDELAAKRSNAKDALKDLKEKHTKLIQNIADQKLNLIVQEVRKKINLDPAVQEQLIKYGITKEKLDEISPNALYEEFNSWGTFLKNFAQISKRSIFAILAVSIILLLLWVNPNNIVERLHLSGRKEIIAFFGVIGPVFVCFYNTFTQFKKLVHPITKFKDDFNKEMEEARFNYTKQADLLASQIEQINNDIEIKTNEIQELKEKEEEIEYELKYSVTKRAFYSFIKAKSKDEKYEKHLGIISTIRRDFETLSELFLDHTNEKNNSSEEKAKIDKKQKVYEDLKEQFKKPLDRIILYIDDLDRCTEEKVLEVLQAVHLLMAFPLFIVVVGVDKRCVNNALNYKNILQYKSLLNNSTEELINHGIQIIQPNEYLEKIFQIPFHIQEISSEGVKNMIDKILTGQVSFEDLEFKNGDITLESLIQEIPETDDVGWHSDLDRVAAEVKKIGDLPNPIHSQKDDLILIENLAITGIEFKYLKEISWLVGNTPRTVKRFLNLYRIVRAHERLTYTQEDRNEEFMIIMFLLGVLNGPFEPIAKRLVDHYQDALDNNNSSDFDYTLESFLNRNPFPRKPDNIDSLCKKVHLKVSECPSFKKLLSSDVSKFQKHLPFIQRFSFN